MANSPLDVVWILLCTVLVIIMQPGFVFFETGLIRSKNSISVAIKNLADFRVVGIIFGLFGYGIMFGSSLKGLVGTSGFFFDAGPTAWDQAFMLFQLSFCATSVTIISGAVAERIRFNGYVITAVITALFIYPIVGHWVWAGHDHSVSQGWLESLGFLDFAGASVVHSVGGSAALAAILVIGPRMGRFDESWPESFSGDNLTFAAAGTFLLIMGWLGFNGGSLLATDEQLPLVFLNTIVAGVFGGFATTCIAWKNTQQPNIVHIMMGILAGLVAITGSCSMVTTLNAAFIGLIAGWISIAGLKILEKYEIDDAVGAVPVHLFPGVWGTVSVGLFGDETYFSEGMTRIDQLAVQLIGSISIVFYSFCFMYALLSLIDRYYSLRASPDVERVGLNVGEHGSKSEVYLFAEKMHAQHETNNFSTRIDINPYSDIGALQIEYNKVLDRVGSEVKKRKAVEDQLRLRARTDGLTQLANRQHFDESLNLEWRRAIREKKDISLIFADIDHFKEYNDAFGHQAGDRCLVRISRMIASLTHRTSDLVARYGGEEFTILLPSTDLNGATIFAESIRAAIAALEIRHASSKIEPFVTMSLGVASTRPEQGSPFQKLIEMADDSLYKAKRKGRNRVEIWS